MQIAAIGGTATLISPTLNEPAHLVAGLSHWKFARFEVYRVNPPLVHYVAALPVILAGYNERWTGFTDTAGARPEFKMGADFIDANGSRAPWLFTLARWGCLIFPLVGAVFCYSWARELWRSQWAGVIALAVWCSEPNILAHGGVVTGDCAATSFGIGATYLFWRWLQASTWPRGIAAGLTLGLACLAKTSWLILFGLWPALWVLWRAFHPKHRVQVSSEVRDGPFKSRWQSESEGNIAGAAWQLGCAMLIATYVINCFYAFDGTFTQLKDYTFVSCALSGEDRPGDEGNRFKGTILGAMPIPLPKQFLRGIDLQKKDFEDYDHPSYLRGEWKKGGWWYYYLYGLAVKTTHGLQALTALAVLAILYQGGCLRRRAPKQEVRRYCIASGLDFLVVMAAPAALFVLVSAQREFNQHIRYVLPVIGFSCVLAGANTTWYCRAQKSLVSGQTRLPMGHPGGDPG